MERVCSIPMERDGVFHTYGTQLPENQTTVTQLTPTCFYDEIHFEELSELSEELSELSESSSSANAFRARCPFSLTLAAAFS